MASKSVQGDDRPARPAAAAKGDDAADVVRQLLEQMEAADLEVITIYYGRPVSAGQTPEALRDELSQLYPQQEIEVVEGGQPFCTSLSRQNRGSRNPVARVNCYG